MDKKEIRRITKHTFADQQSKKESWYGSAVSFHEGANLLGQHMDEITGGLRVFLTNAALSIELLLKAIIVAKGKVAPQTHDLDSLACDAGVGFTKKHRATLELLTAMFKWAGRYPVPTREEEWDHFQDHVLERHVKREKEGNIRRVLKNHETFPTMENYEMLWITANQEWAKVEQSTSG